MISERQLYIETYGCQMNVADSEVVRSVLSTVGYVPAPNLEAADCLLLNTCSVRAGAEQRILARLTELQALRKKKPIIIGVLGCVAERAAETLLEQGADVVCGPDAYLHLPQLLEEAFAGSKGLDTRLSDQETYADILPNREGSSLVSAFVSIMRGCNNFCSYCIVPYTRGRERSRPLESILRELDDVASSGRHEAVLLGQNVNSYNYQGLDFAALLAACAERHPELRFRFTSSHPKDMTDDVLAVIAAHHNVARHIHLPLQSGSSDVLRRMNRHYDREWYQGRVEAIRRFIPDCGLTTDVFCGFPGETDTDHHDTLSLMQWAHFDAAFTFAYSERPGTYASQHLPDDVPDAVKQRRLRELIDLQQQLSLASNQADIGRDYDVLLERRSKRNPADLMGRTSQNKAVVVNGTSLHIGQTIPAHITEASAATLKGEVLVDRV